MRAVPIVKKLGVRLSSARQFFSFASVDPTRSKSMTMFNNFKRGFCRYSPIFEAGGRSINTTNKMMMSPGLASGLGYDAAYFPPMLRRVACYIDNHDNKKYSNSASSSSSSIVYVGQDKKTHVPKQLVAIIGDWAGTFADFGSLSPLYGIAETFAARKIPIEMSVVREPMGLSKLDHFWRCLKHPSVGEVWFKKYGIAPSMNDAKGMLEEYKSIQSATLYKYPSLTILIPEAREAMDRARVESGILCIASTTGFPLLISNIFHARSREQGLHLNACVAADEVERSRPWPDGMNLAMKRMGIDHLVDPASGISGSGGHLVLKIGDTINDVLEGKLFGRSTSVSAPGLSSGAWTMALPFASSELGADTFDDLLAPDAIKHTREVTAMKKLAKARPDFMGDISLVPEVCVEINKRMESGIMPGQLETTHVERSIDNKVVFI